MVVMVGQSPTHAVRPWSRPKSGVIKQSGFCTLIPPSYTPSSFLSHPLRPLSKPSAIGLASNVSIRGAVRPPLDATTTHSERWADQSCLLNSPLSSAHVRQSRIRYLDRLGAYRSFELDHGATAAAFAG